jgi:hypothetical protein
MKRQGEKPKPKGLQEASQRSSLHDECASLSDGTWTMEEFGFSLPTSMSYPSKSFSVLQITLVCKDKSVCQKVDQFGIFHFVQM